MTDFSRRAFLGGMGAVAASAAMPAFAAVADTGADGRIAIIDVSTSPLRWLERMHQSNVKVIARYFARAAQPEFPTKRLAYSFHTVHGRRELESDVLIRNNISILSLYQYKSSTPEKFLKGLQDTPDTSTASGEAKADGIAAMAQARAVSQPKGSAIYFGVDVDVTRNDPLFKSVRNYFEIVRNEIGGDYKIGAYGCGTTCGALLDAKLIDYTWVSASPGHEGTPSFISSGRWHLFQNSLDRKWTNPQPKHASKPGPALDLDTSVQNPKFATFGAWGAGEVPETRTQAIFNSRRFVTRSTGIYKEAGGTTPVAFRTCKDSRSPASYTVDIARNLRSLKDMGEWVYVDVNEDGEADGYCKASDLSAFTRMPVYRREGPKCG